MKKMNKAFTLTELLVALGVIAILCAILLPVVFNLMPNQNTMMAKRAFYTVQTVVAEMLNDEACYPDKTAAPTNPKIGFDDGEGTPNCIDWNDAQPASPINKFYALFGSKIDVTIDSAGNFKTKDGMIWRFNDEHFDSPTIDSNGRLTGSVDGGSIKLVVDVNGSDKPNCGHKGQDYNSILGNGGGDCSTRENGFDRFQMRISGNGQIEINEDDEWAVNAVKVNRNITSDKNSNEEDE